MRPSVLIALAMAAPAFASPLDAGLTPQLIFTSGDANITHVQELYDSLGGTFVLPMEGANGHNMTVEGLFLSRKPAPMFPQSLGNRSFGSEAWFSDAGLDTHSTLEQGLDVRAPVPFTTSNTHCYSPLPQLDQVLTVAQQKFLAEVACNAFETASTGIWVVLGIVIGHVACGGSLQLLCRVVIEIGTAYGGGYIGKGIEASCKETLAILDAACPQVGGRQVVTISENGQRYREYGYATTYQGGNLCHATDNESDPTDCFSYTCNGQCNPGNKLPNTK